MPFYYDTIYWILLIPVLILSVYAQIKVSSSFGRYSQIRNRRGVTGAQAAYEVLRAHGVHDVGIQPCRGNLTDHYDPRDNTIYLSESVCNAAAVAAVVSLTLGVTAIAAKLIGCTLPMLAKKLGFDPAVMASPFITTLVDAVSLLTYFRIAALLLGL